VRKRDVRVAVVALAAAMTIGVPAAAADTKSATYLKSGGSSQARVSNIVVHSGAMDRDVPFVVIKPKDASKPRGVLYLFNGAGGGETVNNWITKTDIVKFLSDKNVYVVIPMAGAATYYTDWQKPDPRLGVNKWSTFLGKELPPIIAATYNTNGRNAVGGISGTATSSLNLAIEYPGQYQAVSSFSGCASTTDPIGEAAVRSVVELRGQANATNMWGPYGGPGWRAHDPTLNAARLRGTALFIATAPGTPGPYDTPQYVSDPGALANQLVVGGILEAGAQQCTLNFLRRLGELKIPATVDMPPAGTHSWGYFQDMFHNAWPFFAKALHA